jgi:hypothetical protein
MAIMKAYDIRNKQTITYPLLLVLLKRSGIEKGNYKLQETNLKQISKRETMLGFLKLFVIWILIFEISSDNSIYA